MINYIFKVSCLVVVLAGFIACGNNKDGNRFALKDGSHVEPVNIQRLDTLIEGYKMLDSLSRVKVLKEDYDVLLGFGMYADNMDTVNNELMNMWSVWPATTVFMPEVRKEFTSLEPESESIGRVLATARQNGFEFPEYNFVAVTWGKPNPIVLIPDKKFAYIALNHYLGPEHQAYNGWPTYICALKSRDMIPVDMAEAILSTAMPYKAEGSGNVLSRILYEGARAVAKQAMVSEMNLSSILGLTPAALTITRQNEAFMWNQLIKDNKLYSTDSELISNLFDIRPNSTAISPDAPGRAVRLVGYNIVKAYMDKNPDATLKFLMSPEFYNDGVNVLRDSGYNPE